MKNGVKNIQAEAYTGACTVIKLVTGVLITQHFNPMIWSQKIGMRTCNVEPKDFSLANALRYHIHSMCKCVSRCELWSMYLFSGYLQSTY